MSADQGGPTKRGPMRRIARLTLVAVLVLCAGWTAIWFYARSVLIGKVDEILQSRGDRPTEIVCTDREVSGFPFGMALSCAKAGVTERDGLLSAELGGLKIGALAYSPRDVSADLRAPLNLDWSAGALPLTADWSDGRANVRLSGDGPGPISTVFERLSIATPLHGIAADHTELHATPVNDNRQTDMVWRAEDATFSQASETSAPFAIDAKARIDAPLSQLMAGEAGTGDIVIPDLDISLAAGESRVSARGAVTLKPAGGAEGEVVVVTENLPALAAFLQTLPSDVRSRVQTLVGGVIALSRPAKNDKGEAVNELTLTLRDNAIYAGTRQIGVIGPGS